MSNVSALGGFMNEKKGRIGLAQCHVGPYLEWQNALYSKVYYLSRDPQRGSVRDGSHSGNSAAEAPRHEVW